MEKKPYVVLARKYRPRGFDDLVGQEPVAQTLKNAIKMGRVGHAYLFTGPRGVGKTSTARIFARALNCKEGPTIEPCGKCEPCIEVEQTRSLDVLEIDGASNRGIDEVRALRENVKFAPASGRFKIYIIDEVHQITPDAFNALLKTLEEPPPHVKFVFATTAAHKVPATILSRCQRFDFRRIPTERIAATLKDICKKEKIEIEDAALDIVARQADGSLRDAESLLDQVAAITRGKVAEKDVRWSLGSIEDEKLDELTAALARRDAKTTLFLLDEVLRDGRDPALFAERLVGHARDLLLLDVSAELASLIDASDSRRKILLSQKGLFSREEIFYLFTVVSQALQTMKRFDAKRVPLEVALVRVAQRAPMDDLSRALDRLRASGGRASAPASPALLATQATPPVRRETPAPEPPRRALASAQAAEEADVEELPAGEVRLPTPEPERARETLAAVWEALIRALKIEKMSVASYLAEGEPMGLFDRVARVSFPESFSFHRESLEVIENKKIIEKHLSVLLARDVRVEFFSIKGAQTRSEAAKPAPAPPSGAVKSAMDIFGGRVVGG